MCMLRELEFLVGSGYARFGQRACKLPHVPMTAQGTKATASFVQGGGNPAQHHMPVAPALHVARVMGNAAIEILDWIGGSQRPVERAIDAQADQGEGFLQAFTKTGCGPGMGLGKGIRQSFELPPGEHWIAAFPSVFHSAPDTGVQFVWQVLDDISALVLLTALNERGSAKD